MAKIDEARVMFNTLCQTLDNMQWKYKKEETEGHFAVYTTAIGKDLTMRLTIHIDVDRQVMYLKSPMPFVVAENMRDVMAGAIARANWSMLNGSFEMDYSDGFVAFKMIVPYMSSMIGADVCRYLIVLSCNMIDKFNDKFKSIAEGSMTVEELQRFISES